MSIYERLGVRKRINAWATLTRLGGSLMAPGVIEAMAEGSRHFVDLTELQKAVGRRLAELTRNEACFVSCGAAAGLAIVTAALVAGDDPARVDQLPHTAGLKDEVVVFRNQRNGYDHAIRQVGVELVEVGYGHAAHPWQLEAAITERTAAVFYFAGAHFEAGALPLSQVVEIAHRKGVAVVVDAAAQIPPVENLWHFTTEIGADVAVFSGGKGLCGPQSSGLVLGRQAIIDRCYPNSPPNASIGRPMKVGKEELCGILAAVEHHLSLDQAQLARRYEDQVNHVMQAVANVPGVSTIRAWPSEAGQPIPRALLTFGPGSRLSRDQVIAALLAGDPAIEVGPVGQDGLYVNPQTLEPGEERLIAERLQTILGA